MTGVSDILVAVSTRHLPDHPASGKDKYAFAYRVTIRNHSQQPVQLLHRYWLITDGNGKNTEVKGEGVLGKQPVIAPHDEYQYTSGALLDTPVGSMQGYYEMENEDGDRFRVPIEIFSLRVPNAIN
ncbi:Co2+/Mg2+ efflux protein ApaG [Aestuariibacter sp. A3R04]|uniref:Co2+/Mg2+ efflux protein ApaG n=1 Tax=Aestuariibacter sp. A3R04 TaxID=2841571 RepID=UPI001C0A1FE6|nr:Co2+/Mg2+ efflux protein ApaG [Aestuariibacter sp. A3R04]MBU3020975.1 Co2+/Mg2+ efflux protein ApaG [Aestuariibacter sp. A3R04]